MNSENIKRQIEAFINGEITAEEVESIPSDNAVDSFFHNIIKRLIRAYSLYANDNKFKNDFLLALRDYLIVFDATIKIRDTSLLKDNSFGIAFDESEQVYFPTYDLPKGVNEKFVKNAFLKEIEKKSDSSNANLVTDSRIFELTGYKYNSFKTLDQKLAVYGALNTPDGYTTLISLPTGGGKSLITQTISYQKVGLTIVVVPTVSLAMDQERATKAVINSANVEEEIFSYSSGVALAPILKAIEEKRARVLFISPEALLENPAFAKAIKEANKTRFLKNIVIDEAHIVVDWGAGFRVDYQCLEAWRNMLLMTNSALRTILLSATFEDKCVETLRNFFEIDGRWIEIRCDALRHEPRFSVVRTRSNHEKEQKVVDMVKKLPHPMIIYVARPADADHYKKLLIDEGINNVETFTGLTGNTQRRKLINEWVEDSFEIMIATSAFGVGVDKSDVRTVIHTYIPQNANTYYQELGRGGRDRLPCLSIMCLHPDDTTIGRDRITKKALTAEKILGRWDSLYNNEKSKRFSNNRVYIDTSIKPNYADADEFDDSPTSDADRNWNVYVLLFLRRYNMIRILEVTVVSGYYMILIEILDDRLRSMDNELTKHVEVIREEEWNYYSDSYNAISNAVRSDCKDCISELFYETYSKVYEFCAGCNAHDGVIVGDVPKFPLKSKIENPFTEVTEEQRALFGDAPEAVVIAKNNEIEQLLNRILDTGVNLLVVPDGFKNNDLILRLNSKRNVLCVGLEEAFQLASKKATYFTSGLVVALYPDEESDIGKQYVVLKNNFCGRSSTKIIHIIQKNAYVDEAGKYFTELVNGPQLQANTVYA